MVPLTQARVLPGGLSSAESASRAGSWLTYQWSSIDPVKKWLLFMVSLPLSGYQTFFKHVFFGSYRRLLQIHPASGGFFRCPAIESASRGHIRRCCRPAVRKGAGAICRWEVMGADFPKTPCFLLPPKGMFFFFLILKGFDRPCFWHLGFLVYQNRLNVGVSTQNMKLLSCLAALHPSDASFHGASKDVYEWSIPRAFWPLLWGFNQSK